MALGRRYIGISGYDYAFVIADTAGRYGYAEQVTDEELAAWADRICRWSSREGGGRDVYVYFDNDAKVHAPHNAMQLAALLGMG